MSDYRAESCEIQNLHDIKQHWCDLQQRADCSYFQSWGWMGNWLQHIASDLDPILIKIWQKDLLVGMGIFVSRKLTRHYLFNSNAVFLNEYPFDGRNMVIVYNGLLADRDHTRAVYEETIRHASRFFNNSDEFFFSGLSASDKSKLQQATDNHSDCQFKTIEKSQTWSLRLDRFDRSIDSFLKTISKNRRAQIRGSIKAYEETGPLQLEEAGSKKEALAFFDGLKILHTERWQSKGGQGSFANPLWEQFHRSLISSRFMNGEIQLLRLSNAGGTIAYLYNFIWRERVYVLQTGFEISNDKRLMPGYVAHAFAIVHNKQKGMAVYDLMHGDSLYKKILCHQSQNLYWLVIQRKRLKFFIEDCSRALVRRLRAKR
ncbi:MAG: GNAT family N-acetyltransferase [Gammaproteobacteria bacterium]|nr:GNAT family N-acetyltransferase [Gammaproteobacteria bacterium]